MKTKHLVAALACLAILTAAAPLRAQYKDVIEEWGGVSAPKPPELKPVTLDSSTAVLSLDFVKQTCNNERRPRCLATIPRVEGLLKRGRGKKVPVTRSTPPAAPPPEFPKEAPPLEGEPIVKASADKFF